jgi:hypothetical protein
MTRIFAVFGAQWIEVLQYVIPHQEVMTCFDVGDDNSTPEQNMLRTVCVGAGRGSRTPKTRRSADFESAASASSAIPALRGSV